MWDPLDPRDLLVDGLRERRIAGYDVSELEVQARRVIESGRSDEIERLLDGLEGAPRLADWPYDEPMTPGELIHSTVPQVGPVDLGSLGDRVLAGWLGRCAGCTLGKPVEGWTREEIRRYLDSTGAYPLLDYIPWREPLPDDFVPPRSWEERWPDRRAELLEERFVAQATRGRVRWVPRDDDIDYSMMNLHVLEEHGFEFTTADIAAEWLNHFPILGLFVASRAAYRNLINGLRPPVTATYRNSYQEWVGARIRADVWGYVNPGKPEKAVELAYRDAVLSHTGNGAYSAAWAAALVSTAFVVTDMRTALEISLAFVPPRSRHAEAVHATLDMHASGVDWEHARDQIERRYGHYTFGDAVNNAAVITAALLWGEGDYAKTVGLSVEGGWDTDSSAATAGSVFGAMHGTACLAKHLTEPLNDSVRSCVAEFDHSTITALAERTSRLALQNVC